MRKIQGVEREPCQASMPAFRKEPKYTLSMSPKLSLTEDLQDGQVIEKKLKTINPFLEKL